MLDRQVTDLAYEDDETDLDAVLRSLADMSDTDGVVDSSHGSATYSDDTTSFTDEIAVPSFTKFKKTATGSASSSASSDISGDSDDGRVVAAPKKRGRGSIGLSATEKREHRKLRNRELAAESRRRKNDEMDTLRRQNSELRDRLAFLESLVPGYNDGDKKRVKASASGLVSAGVAMMALTTFVITAPMDDNTAGVHHTASVLITILDLLDQIYRMTPTLGVPLFALAVTILIASSLTSVGILLRAGARSFGKLVLHTSTAADFGTVPKRATSLLIANSV